MNKFKNESGLEFTNIESESYRSYSFCFADQRLVTVRIDNPLYLNVSKSGGHRLYDSAGISHYVPSGWIHLRWEVKNNKPNFVK